MKVQDLGSDAREGEQGDEPQTAQDLPHLALRKTLLEPTRCAARENREGKSKRQSPQEERYGQKQNVDVEAPVLVGDQAGGGKIVDRGQLLQGSTCIGRPLRSARVPALIQERDRI